MTEKSGYTGGPPPHHLGVDIGPETRVKGGPTHTDDTCRGVLELGQRTAWKSWVAGPHWWGDVNGGAIITNLWHPMMYSSSVGYGYEVVEVSLFFTIKTEAFSQNIGKVLLISKLESLEQLFHIRSAISTYWQIFYPPNSVIGISSTSQQVTTIVYMCGWGFPKQ